MQFETNDPEPKKLSRCDRFNAQFMRWRLRKHFPETGDAEERGLMEMIAISGSVRPPRGTPVPLHADDENLAAAIVFDLVLAWREGRLKTFSERYLSGAARLFLQRHHHKDRHKHQTAESLEHVEG